MTAHEQLQLREPPPADETIQITSAIRAIATAMMHTTSNTPMRGGGRRRLLRVE